jgi:hypothetical protein
MPYPLCLIPYAFYPSSLITRHSSKKNPPSALRRKLSRNAAFFWGKQFSFLESSFSSEKAAFLLGTQFLFLESSFFSGKAVFLLGKQFFFLESSVFSWKAVFRFGNALLFKECAVLGLYVCGVTILSCGSKIIVSDNQRVVNFLRFFSTRSKIPAPDLRSHDAKGSPVSVA